MKLTMGIMGFTLLPSLTTPVVCNYCVLETRRLAGRPPGQYWGLYRYCVVRTTTYYRSKSYVVVPIPQEIYRRRCKS